MPIYEYLCDSCGETVEILQKISDPPPEACPSDDGGKLIRILSAHNVGSVASGAAGALCERSDAPTCGGCDMAGTGCS